MAKIGTAHIEIKPVLSDEALDLITERIEAAVRAGVEAGMKAGAWQQRHASLDGLVAWGDVVVDE